MARVACAASFLLVLICSKNCSAYSLLTHEQIVDIAWKDDIVPVLLARFPGATEAQLRDAHAFAYGGCLIQDIGYYPFGHKYFSDLTHYVRSGDFVASLIRESSDLNQYAFAFGSLAHYSSDNSGHPLVNRAVALNFPHLRAKYGEVVTYEKNPTAHIRVEFGFDMAQVAKGRYTSENYHAFIGFAVSKPVLERAVMDTYGLTLTESLGPEDLAIGTFRRSVSQLIPALTKVALAERRPELIKEYPNFSEKRFLYNLSRSEYEREWGRDYRKPGAVAKVIAWLIRWIPKVGPLKGLHFVNPTPETEDLYFKSVNRTVETYKSLLKKVAAGDLDIPDLDCDTGNPAAAHEYGLSDETYARLLDQHAKRGLTTVAPDLRTNILAFYRHAYTPPTKSRKARDAWCKTVMELRMLYGIQNEPGYAGTHTNEFTVEPPVPVHIKAGAHGH